MIDGALPPWRPERVVNAIDQDDLYVEMTFAEVMDRKGLDATSADFGEAFRTSKYNLWHANAAARRLLKDRRCAASVGHAAVQLSRQRHRLSDRVGFHRADVSRTAARRARFLRASGLGDEFRRRPLRRYLRHAACTRRRSSNRIRVASSKRAWRRCRRRAAMPPSFATCWPGTARILTTGVVTWRRIEETWDRNDACPGRRRSAPSTSTRD